MALAPGTCLGSFEILALIGAGGMGEVYRARDGSLKRDVAIKVLPPSYTSDGDRLRRFQLEAQSAAALNHPNILSVYHIGQHGDSPYIVSELLEGETLRERLRRGPMRLREALDVAIAVAHGLAAAHAKGIVHRDLKPENLFILKDGRVKILDFGLAKLTQVQVTAPDSLTLPISQQPQSNPGLVVGTVGYMSPEQVRGRPADARSDIFSLGCVLYEMLTGRRAFHKPTSAETMTAILNDDPPVPSQIAPATPPALQRIIRRCLEKNPEQRFQSAEDLAFAMDALSESSSSQEVALDRKSPRRRVLAWTAGALALAALATALYFHRSSLTAAKDPNPSTLEVRPLTETGRVRRAAITPDGSYIAYVNGEAGKYDLRLLQVATGRDVQLLPASPFLIKALHFSPDGNFIYFLRQVNLDDQVWGAGALFRIAALGGPATRLATDAQGVNITVSPDGKQIAYISRTPTESLVVSVDPDGANRRVLATRPAGSDFFAVEWSPAQDRLAAVARSNGKELWSLLSVALPNGAMKNLTSGWNALMGTPAWGRDGTVVFVPVTPFLSAGSTQIWAVDVRTGVRRTLTSSATNYNPYSLSATASGDLVALTAIPALTLWVTGPGAKPQPIPSVRSEGAGGTVDSVTWIDGRVIASNGPDLYLHDLDSPNSTRLQSYSTRSLRLARCGPAQVAYAAFDTKHELHIARTDINTSSTAPLTDGPRDISPTCTSDGSTLVYAQCTEGPDGCSLMRKSIESGQTVALCKLGLAPIGYLVALPTISPDGTEVLFRRQPGAGEDPHEWAMMIAITGGEVKKIRMPVSVGEARYLKWAPDGRAILYSHTENGAANIWSAPIDGGAPKKLTNFDSDNIYAFDVSPDNRLAISRGSITSDVVLIKNAR